MAGQFLCVLWRNSGIHQFRYEPVPQTVKVGNPSLGVAIHQEPGCFTLGLLVRRHGLGQPQGASGGEVQFDEIGGFVVQRPLPWPESFSGRASGEPPTQFRNQGKMKRNFIATAVLRVRCFDRNNRRVSVEGE